MIQISYYLPEAKLTNSELAGIYTEWTEKKIYLKTGIEERRISAANEHCSDMAVCAAEKLFEEYNIDKKTVDFIILITQSPDYQLPTTACMVQDRLGISKSAGAFDINLGCSGYIYGLAVAKSLLVSGISKKVLLITSEVYTKHIHPMDKSVRTIFGDAASATILDYGDINRIGEFILGSDGSNYDKLIIPSSGTKKSSEICNNAVLNDNIHSGERLYMDGSEIFNFTIDIVPEVFQQILDKHKLNIDDIDLFVFHQANKFMLDYLMKIIKIPKEKFYVNIRHIGNTVSSSIPIALRMAETDGILKRGYKVMLIGFGVGLSWGATIITY